jgi:hypothetical protein
MWRTYTAELIIALNAVLDPKYMHPRSPTITATQSWALNGEPSLGLTRAHTFDKGRPSSREKAQNTRPVPVGVRGGLVFERKAVLT